MSLSNFGLGSGRTGCEWLRPRRFAAHGHGFAEGLSGSLESSVARYAMYRYFLVERGWHIKDLSLEAVEANISSPALMLKSGVPSLIIELLKDQVGIDRLGLEELAVLAATIEDLVHRDSVDLLELAYKTRDLSTDEPLDREDADRLIRPLLCISCCLHRRSSLRATSKPWQL